MLRLVLDILHFFHGYLPAAIYIYLSALFKSLKMHLTVFFIASLLVSWCVTRLLLKSKFALDRGESHRKSQSVPVPRLGGIGLFLGLSSSLLIAKITGISFGPAWMAPLTVTGCFFALGLLDDFYPLGAKWKLAGQIGIALLGYAMGLRIENLTSPLSINQSWQLGSFSPEVTVLWLIAIPNIINLIDGMDGLASGLAFFVCATLAIVVYSASNTTALILLFAAMGSISGFLFFNLPPARIYLGDGGAYLLGAFLATVSLECSQKGSLAAVLIVVMLALGLPILDTGFAIIRRGIRGVPIFRADAEHIHHRLLRLGFSKPRALLVMYIVCIGFCTASLSMFASKGYTTPIIAGGFFLVAILGIPKLGFVRKWSELFEQIRRVNVNRLEVRRACRHANFLESELKHCRSADEFWALFWQFTERLGFCLPNESARSLHKLDSVRVHKAGNPFLELFYRSEKTDRNWWGMAECLYPIYVSAVNKWNPISKPLGVNLAQVSD